jgi:hypothetical protein
MILVSLIKLHKSNRSQYVTCVELSIIWLAMQFLLVIMNNSSFDVKKNGHNLSFQIL